MQQQHSPERDLDERLEKEARFHDAKYGGEELYPRHYSVMPTQYVYEKMKEMLGELSGRHVLEYGCGEGWITRDLAQLGARVSAFDVSPQAIDNTARVLSKAGLSEQCSLQVMPAERLAYPDSNFDVAVGFAIIHHLDLPKALAELHRVLRPGGVAYFAEPLATNPAIQLYRKLTPQFRTEDERPLYLNELPHLLKAFASYEHCEYFLTALAALGAVYLPGGRKIFPSLSGLLHRLDARILSVMPGLGNWAWYSIIKIIR